jgi:uncharacterized membrane protein SpoIIM required for sporulation
VTLDRFLKQGEPTWAALQSLLTKAGSNGSSLTSTEVVKLASLYRTTAADLAFARARFDGDPVISRLETLAIRARSMVYRKRRKRVTVVDFYRRRYWQLIVERRAILLLASLALVGPMVIGFLYAVAAPESVQGILPEGFLWVTTEQPAGTDIGANSEQLAAFSFTVLTNNIRVTLTAFALGITLGLATFALIAFNGLIFGALTALAFDAGNGALFIEAVAAHGVLELSCIVIGGAAGFRIAAAIVNPGLRPRRVAIVEESGQAALLAIGTAPFLFLAGFIEGFVSRTGTTALPAVLIGFGVGGAFWLAAVMLGTTQNDTRDLAPR